MLKVDDFIEESLEKIENTLKEFFSEKGNILHEAGAYALKGGKRLRPLLTLAVLETFDVPLEKGLFPACALELIHTYSLIHDDLPCMDNDDFRRGKPTLHKVYPESYAVLTGDFLLTYAFELLASSPFLTEKEKLELSATIAKRAGSSGMIGGQVMDIRLDLKSLDKETLFDLYSKKTASLITAALECGGIIANTELSPLRKIGMSLGLGFQLMDDLLDEDGGVTLLGKTATKELIDHLFRESLEAVSSLQRQSPILEVLVKKFLYRDF